MNNVERFVLALQGGRPDRIPVLPKIWLDTAAKLAGVDLTEIAGQPQSATRLIPQVAARFGFDAARLHLFPERRLEKGENTTWELDAAGQRLGPIDLSGGLAAEPRPPGDFDWSDPATLFSLQFRPTLIEEDADFDWAAVAVPDVAFYEKRYGATIRGVLQEFDGRLCGVGDCDTASLPFFARFRGVQGVMMDLLLRPEFARECFQLGINFVVQRARFLIDCGCRVLRLNDSMANMNLISPAQWREFVGPVFTEVCRQIRAYQPDVRIYCHVCGNVMPVLADLRQTGLDCIGPMDPLGGMDVGRAREILGPGYCLMGGVNTMTLAKGTPAEVSAECRTVLAKARAREGAFILGSGCALSRLTTAANLQALRESVDQV
jgi:uroporphyrinogen-III decarboxylase